MPYLLIQTNRTADNSTQAALISQVSKQLAAWLGKPEHYVMVTLQSGSNMLFGGNDAPCAYLELKSIGLPESELAGLAANLCRLIGDVLGIGAERIYIEFSAAEPQWWGWNSATF